jgi:hypothetical protein
MFNISSTRDPSNIFTSSSLHFNLGGIFGRVLKHNVNSSNSTTSFLLGIFEKKDVT